MTSDQLFALRLSISHTLSLSELAKQSGCSGPEIVELIDAGLLESLALTTAGRLGYGREWLALQIDLGLVHLHAVATPEGRRALGSETVNPSNDGFLCIGGPKDGQYVKVPALDQYDSLDCSRTIFVDGYELKVYTEHAELVWMHD